MKDQDFVDRCFGLKFPVFYEPLRTSHHEPADKIALGGYCRYIDVSEGPTKGCSYLARLVDGHIKYYYPTRHD